MDVCLGLGLATLFVMFGACAPKAPPPPPCALQSDMEVLRADMETLSGGVENVAADLEQQSERRLAEEVAKLRAELKRCGCRR